jgi:dolichol-phosphate mannosyltransferase
VRPVRLAAPLLVILLYVREFKHERHLWKERIRTAMSDTGKTLVTIATYNEIENLPSLVEEIFRHAPQADVLVIDDNSPDGTGRWCDGKAGEVARLHCLHRAGKLGLGTAIIAGMRYGIEHDYKYVLNMDADFSHPPGHLPALIAGMAPEGFPPVDVMIASRYVAGGGVEGWPLRRHLISRSVNLYARCLLALKPKDCSGAFRCYRAETLAKLDFQSIISRGYSFQEEILWRLKRVGARFDEMPYVFIDRRKGRSKINMHEAFAALGVIFSLAIRGLFRR